MYWELNEISWWDGMFVLAFGVNRASYPELGSLKLCEHKCVSTEHWPHEEICLWLFNSHWGCIAQANKIQFCGLNYSYWLLILNWTLGNYYLSHLMLCHIFRRGWNRVCFHVNVSTYSPLHLTKVTHHRCTCGCWHVITCMPRDYMNSWR